MKNDSKQQLKIHKYIDSSVKHLEYLYNSNDTDNLIAHIPIARKAIIQAMYIHKVSIVIAVIAVFFISMFLEWQIFQLLTSNTISVFAKLRFAVIMIGVIYSLYIFIVLIDTKNFSPALFNDTNQRFDNLEIQPLLNNFLIDDIKDFLYQNPSPIILNQKIQVKPIKVNFNNIDNKIVEEIDKVIEKYDECIIDKNTFRWLFYICNYHIDKEKNVEFFLRFGYVAFKGIIISPNGKTDKKSLRQFWDKINGGLKLKSGDSIFNNIYYLHGNSDEDNSLIQIDFIKKTFLKNGYMKIENILEQAYLEFQDKKPMRINNF